MTPFGNFRGPGAQRTHRREDVQSTRRTNRSLVLYSTLLLAIVIIVFSAPLIAPHDPLQPDIAHRLQPPTWRSSATKSGLPGHPLGTDELGRDVLSRILYGARTSLIVTVLASALGALIGSVLGLIAGYKDGGNDLVLGRMADIQQALPFIVLVLAIAAVAGPSLVNVVLVLGFSSWVVHYRIVRAATKAVREEPYIEAARALGLGDVAIVRRHIFPNVLPVIIVNVTNTVPQLMLFEAALSFLGLGVPPPIPTWGGMVAAGRGYIEVAWWLSVLPGLALMATVLGVHGLSEEVSRRLDPKRRATAPPTEGYD